MSDPTGKTVPGLVDELNAAAAVDLVHPSLARKAAAHIQSLTEGSRQLQDEIERREADRVEQVKARIAAEQRSAELEGERDRMRARYNASVEMGVAAEARAEAAKQRNAELEKDRETVLRALGWSKGVVLEAATPTAEILGRIKALKRSIGYYRKGTEEAGAAVCPLARGDPHEVCVLAVDAQDSRDAALGALREFIRIDGFISKHEMFAKDWEPAVERARAAILKSDV